MGHRADGIGRSETEQNVATELPQLATVASIFVHHLSTKQAVMNEEANQQQQQQQQFKCCLVCDKNFHSSGIVNLRSDVYPEWFCKICFEKAVNDEKSKYYDQANAYLTERALLERQSDSAPPEELGPDCWEGVGPEGTHETYVATVSAATETNSLGELSDRLHDFVADKTSPSAATPRTIETIYVLAVYVAIETGSRWELLDLLNSFRRSVYYDEGLSRSTRSTGSTVRCFVRAGKGQKLPLPGVRYKDSKAGVEWVTHGAYRTYILRTR
eukprot:GHVU01001804.1.p1 GENE.GHVU01001804.1~~GHVU01001804.1.p1  ORF type:complete len:271 (+),score=41.32 GHVU01001804.1:92-904(+)